MQAIITFTIKTLKTLFPQTFPYLVSSRAPYLECFKNSSQSQHGQDTQIFFQRLRTWPKMIGCYDSSYIFISSPFSCLFVYKGSLVQLNKTNIGCSCDTIQSEIFLAGDSERRENHYAGFPLLFHNYYLSIYPLLIYINIFSYPYS